MYLALSSTHLGHFEAKFSKLGCVLNKFDRIPSPMSPPPILGVFRSAIARDNKLVIFINK